ncbi:MAG: phospho-sugar mutase [Bacteroidales bacterium]|nr:phospho-sugar mutase [Bacteroidales bacterium]
MAKDLTQQHIDSWLNGNFDEGTKKEILRMQAEDPAALSDAFYRTLEFGTGGMRGILGVGTNRMNKYTVGFATQGLANYLIKCCKQNIKVAISFDSRNYSTEFAQIAANILAANDIQVFLFDSLRPTPELSFAVRHLQCNAGIMITASHNPKEYNGYKVYWNDGGQLVPPHDKNVINEVNKIKSLDQVKWDGRPDLIRMIGKDIDNVYLTMIKRLTLNPETVAEAKDLCIVYTPLHGTGISVVPKALSDFGFKNVHIVEEQAVTDGNFPTVKSPNPEEHAALELAIAKAKKVNADIVLATDPDADRVGIAVRCGNGDYQLFNGNQTATLLFHYVLSQTNINPLENNFFVVKTIVTTDLINQIATDYNVECFDVLTGFKYIAEKIREFEGSKQFLVGGEESYGYLIGDFVRDKDAVSACCLIAEMTAYYKTIYHRSLIDQLELLYNQYQYFKEDMVSLTEPGEAGMQAIQQRMSDLREQSPKTLCKQPVVKILDYKAQRSYNTITKTSDQIELPVSNVLQFITSDGSKVTVRPSGTEPKIKFYFSVCENIQPEQTIQEVDNILKERIAGLKKDLGLC